MEKANHSFVKTSFASNLRLTNYIIGRRIAMANKNNIRSIRISDDILELIDRQAGNNFTEKWENLVTRCVWELPQKEKELQRIQEQIRRENEKLKDLWKSSREWRMTMQNINARIMALENALDQEMQLREQ